MFSSTEIIHSIPVDELTGAISVPIYQTSTFVQEAPGVNQGFDYSRTNNPTRKALEDIAAKLEKGSNGFAFASGLAAIDAVIKLFSAGDEILAVDDIYGGTYRLLTQVYSQLGIKVKFCDTTEIENLVNEITPATKCIWIESPTNPTLKISDIEQIAKIAKANNAFLVVDNTFATPVLQRPIELGADIVIHSATKYLAGHSDVIAGLVITKTKELGDRIKFIQNATGSILGPFDSWLTIRGIETLPLRIEKHSNNAQYIAEELINFPQIKNIYYPGLKSHKNHEVATKRSKHFGGIISFTLEDDTIEAAVEFVKSTKLFKLAESLGGVKSLICHPAQMTHKSTPADIRRAAGINDSLIRLSVGLEDAKDLLNDIAQAFDKIENSKQIKIAEGV